MLSLQKVRTFTAMGCNLDRELEGMEADVGEGLAEIGVGSGKVRDISHLGSARV